MIVDPASYSRAVLLIRGQPENHNRRIGRVDLAIGRIRRKVRRQISLRGVDTGLYIACRAIDVTAEVKLQSDHCVAERTRRSHLSNSGDMPELALQRCGDRSSHDFRARAG